MRRGGVTRRGERESRRLCGSMRLVRAGSRAPREHSSGTPKKHQRYKLMRVAKSRKSSDDLHYVMNIPTLIKARRRCIAASARSSLARMRFGTGKCTKVRNAPPGRGAPAPSARRRARITPRGAPATAVMPVAAPAPAAAPPPRGALHDCIPLSSRREKRRGACSSRLSSQSWIDTSEKTQTRAEETADASRRGIRARKAREYCGSGGLTQAPAAPPGRKPRPVCTHTHLTAAA